MKIRLTPELSYLIGFWLKRRTHEGIGVEGEPLLLEVFSKALLDTRLTTADRLLHARDTVYFYHTAYRRFFQDVEREQLDRYRYLNDYAASFLAGLFDSCGGIDERGIVYITRTNPRDEMMLIRLGFGAQWKGNRLVIGKPLAFLAFIRNYVKVHAGHRAFGLLGKERKGRKPDAAAGVPASAAG